MPPKFIRTNAVTAAQLSGLAKHVATAHKDKKPTEKTIQESIDSWILSKAGPITIVLNYTKTSHALAGTGTATIRDRLQAYNKDHAPKLFQADSKGKLGFIWIIKDKARLK